MTCDKSKGLQLWLPRLIHVMLMYSTRLILDPEGQTLTTKMSSESFPVSWPHFFVIR